MKKQEPKNSRWIHALRKLDALVITPRALAMAERNGDEASKQDILLANRYLNRLVYQGKLTRLARAVYAFSERLAESEPVADRLVEALRASGWDRIVDVWQAYLLLYASPDVRAALWQDPNRETSIRAFPDYSDLRAESAALALWVATRKGSLTRLGEGIYVLPGAACANPFALSMRMSDPIITCYRAKILLAHWRGLLDDRQAQELWEASPNQIDEVIKGIPLAKVREELRRAKERGVLVKIKRGQWIHHELAERGQIPRLYYGHGSIWQHALKLALSRSNAVSAKELAQVYLELQKEGRVYLELRKEELSRVLRMARAYLARQAHKGEVVRVKWGLYTTHERAVQLKPSTRQVEEGSAVQAHPSRPWCSPRRLMEALRGYGWRGAFDTSRAYLLIYAPPEVRDALWRRADRELLIRDLDTYSRLHYQYASAALCDAGRLGWLVRLRKGVYALPGTIQPEGDMAAIALRMPDPLVTPRRAKLLHAYWLGRLDEDQVAELWGASDEQVNATLGAFAAPFRAAHYLKLALARGCLVKLGHGRYVHPQAVYALECRGR